jgi:hypothetical protein
LSLPHLKTLRGKQETEVFCQGYEAHAKFREYRSPLSDV